MGNQKTKDEIVVETLALAAQEGWGNLTFSRIAEHTGVTLFDLRTHFDDKMDILSAFGRMVDRIVLKNMESDKTELSPRERLFDVLMERFDVLNVHREGIISVLESFQCDPKQVVISLPHLCHSMSWMCEAAGVEVKGASGGVKITALTIIYINILRFWIKDESPDLSKTMAVLDQSLDRAERWGRTFGVS